jgi:hypothetical protein
MGPGSVGDRQTEALSMTKANDNDRPLIVAAEERSREIAAQCLTVERACRAIGWAARSKIERVAVLVARLVGLGVMRSTVDRIAGDASVDCTPRHAARALERLAEIGVLSVDLEQAPPMRRVGRPPVQLRLAVRWDYVRGVVADADRWEARMRAEILTDRRPYQMTPETISGGASEFRTSSGRVPDAGPTRGGHAPDYCSTGGGLLDRIHIPVLPINVLPPSPYSGPAFCNAETNAEEEMFSNQLPDGYAAGDQPDALEEIAGDLPAAFPVDDRGDGFDDWDAAEAAVRAAGVDAWARLVDAARANGYTPAALIDDAYVVQHSGKLRPGALFYRVTDRGRCWPTSGVPNAETVRRTRSTRADAVRSKAADEAPHGTPYAVLVAVTVDRLERAGLGEFVTDREAALAAAQREAVRLKKREQETVTK